MFGRSWDEMAAAERLEDLDRRIGEARTEALIRRASSVEPTSAVLEVKKPSGEAEDERRAA